MDSTPTARAAATVTRQLLHPTTHDQLQQYVRDYAPMMGLGVDDEIFHRRYAHNPPHLVHVHRQLTDWASAAFGEPLKPSYVFLSIYHDGGRCPLHLDRPQCYRTIDYLISQDSPDPWPLCVGRPMDDTTRQALDNNDATNPKSEDDIAARIAAETWDELLLRPNDAALYSGTHQWHYRPTTLAGAAALAFFHFVPADWEGTLD